METLGSFVKARRELLGQSATAIAAEAGMSKSEISSIENGRISLPGADKRRRLAKALGVNHVDLLIAAGELLPDEVYAGYIAGDAEASELEALYNRLPDADRDRLMAIAHALYQLSRD